MTSIPQNPAGLGQHVSDPLRGAVFMAGAAFCFAGMIGLIRAAGAELHPFQIAFFRNAFGLLVLLPWLVRVRFSGLRTQHLPLHLLRALLGVVSMFCWFTALTLMPLGEAVALSFTAPLFATIGAALILGEMVRARRWTATIIGFTGVLVIAPLSIEALQGTAGLVLASAALGGASAICVKRLSDTESSASIVAYMVLLLTPLSLVAALFVWQWPSWTTLGLVAGIGALGSVAHLCFARAMHEADASAMMPLEYLRLPLVAAIGYFAFDEVVSARTWAGAALIGASALYIAHREAKLSRPALAARAGKDKM